MKYSQTYHNTHLNPRLGTLFHTHPTERKSCLIARFLKHNASEVGHNELAFDDLAALEEDVEGIRASQPLVATEALAAFRHFASHFKAKAQRSYLWKSPMTPASMGPAPVAVADQGPFGVPDSAAAPAQSVQTSSRLI